MKISFFDKIMVLCLAYKNIFLLPAKYIPINLAKPIDAARYFEFSYLLKFLREKKLKKMDILDVSSPFMIDYIIAANNKVEKINIDEAEKKFINENNKNLSFVKDDATNLKYEDEKFDFVYEDLAFTYGCHKN